MFVDNLNVRSHQRLPVIIDDDHLTLMQTIIETCLPVGPTTGMFEWLESKTDAPPN
jgi:hypothetical protein